MNRVDVQVVEVDVVVTDRKGRPVHGLEREDFHLRVDGQPVEITNFFESSVQVEPARNGRRGAAPAPATIQTDGGPLTVVFYLDDANLRPPHRTRLLRRMETAVEPWRAMDATYLLARFEHRMELLVPPTRDLNDILTGVAARPEGSTRGLQGGSARRFAIRGLIDSHEACERARYCRPCEDNWGELLSIARQYADEQATRAAIAVDGLADLVTMLAGLQGKKAVVYMTDGLPQRPGLSVLEYLGGELCAGLRQSAHSETMAEIVQYDEVGRFNRLSAHANANRVTFYALDAAGQRSVQQDIALDNPRLGPSSRNAGLRAVNAQSGLYRLADETGGKALVNANDLAILLDDMTGQLAASYSLGYHATEAGSGEVRQISVQLAPDALKGRRIAYRRAWRDKPLEERLAERLHSAARLGRTENPLRASIEFGGAKRLDKRNAHQLTVGIRLPEDSIFLLPGSGGTASQLRVWLLALREETGARTAVRQKRIAVGGENGMAATDGVYRLDVAMALPEGDYTVAVGVRQEATGEMSLIRDRVAVPGSSPASSPD